MNAKEIAIFVAVVLAIICMVVWLVGGRVSCRANVSSAVGTTMSTKARGGVAAIWGKIPAEESDEAFLGQ
jgi:hypothetical protein